MSMKLVSKMSSSSGWLGILGTYVERFIDSAMKWIFSASNSPTFSLYSCLSVWKNYHILMTIPNQRYSSTPTIWTSKRNYFHSQCPHFPRNTFRGKGPSSFLYLIKGQWNVAWPGLTLSLMLTRPQTFTECGCFLVDHFIQFLGTATNLEIEK